MKTPRAAAAIVAGLTLTAGVVLAAPTAQAATSTLQIVKVQFDSPGTDLPTTNSKLNGEYVQIKNKAKVTRTLTDWHVYDNSNHVYTFGSTKIKAGQTLTLRTGSGTNKGGLRYWDAGYYVWNNTTDTAHLSGPDDKVASTCRWTTSTPGSSVLCNR